MKKIIGFLIILILITTGCGKYSEDDVINDLDKKVNNNNYYLEGNLEIVNNDEVYNYDIDVSYKKSDNYKVRLLNKSNNHEQIILKNSDGVFVVTPALNKSFKFQSDWPYNNSQIYLLQSIVTDIKSDNKKEFKEEKNGYTFITEVNYPNNRKLVKQEISMDKKLNIKKVKVYNENNVPLMTMTFKKIDTSPTFKKDYFTLDTVMESSLNTDNTKTASKLDDSIYPLVLPTGTKLSNEEKVKKTNGERVILTFDGEKPFLLVEETANVFDEFTIVPTSGEPYILQDTIGVLGENSLTWATGGIEYYIVSDVLNQNELVEIASSISSLPTMK
ncbi:MAG: outer membrane lipoprotein carrier protein LolA [Bacilli bacterium]|nr:outer membrane lipoprotein carrier protein LolA [Bacilli bacterium]